ncbi:RNA-dependent RNA polymerase [Erysiphe necator associated ourmia-like virus 51]|nr:RNA-dependent RNA polymerase [Erysiphe necator associated ourmia-like virus 51]
MGKPAAKADPAFLRFIQEEIPKIFKRGWDRNYSQVASTLCLSTSSCLENPKSCMGSRGSSSPLSRLAFQRAVGMEPFPETGHYCRVVPVNDGGKWRVITVNSSLCEALKPWHQIMYNHLSKKDWLCRGEPNVKGFCRKEGEVFVSGDYQSATDAIPTKVYLAMLGALCAQSESIPMSVKEFALSESRKVFVDESLNVLGNQRRGQLMGSYLSFPFLCLLNYLCFKFSVRRRVPLLINGDDIVFRCSPEEKDRWIENVRRSGLILSKGKTLVHDRIFTLNSTLFRGGKDRGKSVGFFRPKAYFKCPGSGGAAAGQFRSLVVGFPGSIAKDRIQVAFLRRYNSFLLKRQLPLRAALGFRVSDRVLRMSGFYDHERYYLGLGVNKMPASPSAVIPGGFVRCPVPKGGEARRNARVSDSLFFRELGQLTWLPSKKVDNEEVFGLNRYVKPLKGPKFAKKWLSLLGRGTAAYLGKMGGIKRERKDQYWKNVRVTPSTIRFSWSGWLVGQRVEPEVLVFKGRITAKA